MRRYRGWMLTLLVCALAAGTSCSRNNTDTGGKRTPTKPIRSEADTHAAFKRLLASRQWRSAAPPRNPQGLLRAVEVNTGLTFLLIPAGTFQMGSPESDKAGYRQERPVHTVDVPAFLLCETECTQVAWERAGGEEQLVLEQLQLRVGRSPSGEGALERVP